LQINFEESITIEDFIDFDEANVTLTNNPMVSGMNTSASIARIVRDGNIAF
jgi:hypothetical protein